MKHIIGTFYRKVVLRHLTWSRPEAALDVLEQFLDEARECDYSFRLTKLRKRMTVDLE